MNLKSVRVGEELFHGVVSVEFGDGWVKPWRIPFEQRELFSPIPESGLAQRAECPSGVRLRCATDSRKVGLTVTPDEESPRKFDLVWNNELLQTVELPAGGKELTFDELPDAVPAGQNVLEIWLAVDRPVAVHSLRLADGASFAPADDPRKKWITYGSSITHCTASHSPAQTWPAHVARTCDLNLTSLGYGGQCHMEGMMVRMIRDLPADVITLKLGINMHGSTAQPRTFKPAVISFIQILREKHPAIPIGVISPIFSQKRETTQGQGGYTLQTLREALVYCVDLLRSHGDENLHYFDGLAMLGPNLADHLPDDLHPDGDGYLKLGQNIVSNVMSKLLA